MQSTIVNPIDNRQSYPQSAIAFEVVNRQSAIDGVVGSKRVSVSTMRRRLLSRGCAAVLLLAWLIPIVAPHSAADDVLCVPNEAASGAAAVKAQAGVHPPPHHCVICHTLRSYRVALNDCGPAATILTAERVDPLPTANGLRAAALHQLPARAPPA
jgi:hypothetical protein